MTILLDLAETAAMFAAVVAFPAVAVIGAIVLVGGRL